ncbi:MAG: cyclic nucleotide-binding domain-containing protein [Verrucomicrobiota bacterium]
MIPLDWIRHLPEKQYSSGEQIVTKGLDHDCLFFLKSGKVEVVRDGYRITLIKTPGSVLGEMSVLLKLPATADVVATKEVSCHVAENPMDFLRQHPDIAVQVGVALAYRVDAATKYLVDVKEQMKDCSDHVGMVDGVLDAIVHRDVKKKLPLHTE